MKKIIITISMMFLVSCGFNNSQETQQTSNGEDYSQFIQNNSTMTEDAVVSSGETITQSPMSQSDNLSVGEF